MASSPRTGRSNAALRALLVGILVIVGVIVALAAGFDFAATGQNIVTGLMPPIAVTDRAEQIRGLYVLIFGMAAVIFVVVEGLIIWTVIRYRRRPGDDALPPQTHGNAIAEIVWTVVPTIIVLFMFALTWNTLTAVDAVSQRPQVKVRALAAQFLWTFDYLPPEYDPNVRPPVEPLFSVTTPVGAPDEGGLVLPAGRTVQVFLESPDVIHAFYVPQFLFKRDVVPGRINTFEFTIQEEDAGKTFRGQCAELCGAGHGAMRFDVHAMSGADYDAWVEAKIAEANATPPPAPSGQPTGQPGRPGAPPLAITALNIAYDVQALTAPADTPFQIAFNNQDDAIPHNVAIHEGSPTGPEVWRGEIFPGPAEKIYDVPPLAAGSYGFICTVHPNMTGTLTVQ